MTQEELTNVFKYIVKKCDMLINNDHYEADAYTQDTVEDIAELCNHILDGNHGKLVEVKEVDLDLITAWFDHIAQIADDRMTLTNQRMTDAHALDEIKCLAKDSAEFITKYYKTQKGE